MLALVLAFLIGASAAQAPAPEQPPAAEPPAPGVVEYPAVAWRESRVIGKPFAGRLRRGVQLPEQGSDHFTWHPIERVVPNRPYRRWAAHTTVATLLDVLAEHRTAHPLAPRVGIGDLSRKRGGDFGPEFGGLGHASHQNGLDIDVYYPRVDGEERQANASRAVDLALSQDLVDRFVAAGAEYVFVGRRLGLSGPRGIVQPLGHHGDHLHVRLPRPPRAPAPR